MANSEQLSFSLTNTEPKNKESKDQDAKIMDVSYRVLAQVKKQYPGYFFGVDKKFKLHMLASLIDTDVDVSDSSFFKPDGGLLWIKIWGRKHYFLFPEQKRQGTNDKRLKEGKKKQQTGNATERIADKLCVARLLFGDDDVFPFVAFIQGCDFYEPESLIPDRLKRIFNFIKPNVIHYNWIKLQNHNSVGGSYFMRGHSMNDEPGTSDFTEEEMYEIMIKIATHSIDYYIKKYDNQQQTLLKRSINYIFG